MGRKFGYVHGRRWLQMDRDSESVDDGCGHKKLEAVNVFARKELCLDRVGKAGEDLPVDSFANRLVLVLKFLAAERLAGMLCKRGQEAEWAGFRDSLDRRVQRFDLKD